MLLDLSKVRVFTNVVARNGYWHWVLEEESAKMTTFDTPFGLACVAGGMRERASGGGAAIFHFRSRLRNQNKSTRWRNPASYAGYIWTILLEKTTFWLLSIFGDFSEAYPPRVGRITWWFLDVLARSWACSSFLY